MSKPPAKLDTDENEEGVDIDVLGPLFRPDKREQGEKLVTMMVRRSHSGPLPAPETYAHYDHVNPGSAERILAMAEREQAHRHTMDGRVVTHEYGIRYVGQFGAVIALMALCAVVVYCASIEQPLAAGVIGAIGAIVVAFLRYTQIKMEAGPEEQPQQPSKKQPQRRRK